MDSPSDISVIISMADLTSYMLASGLMVLGFKSSGLNRLWTRLGYMFFALGTMSVTVHALLLGKTALFLAAAVAWGTIISWFVWQVELVGAFTAPVITVILLSSIFLNSTDRADMMSHSAPSMRLHIASAIIGQSFAILACGMSLLFLWLDRKLKNRQISDLPRKFPAISTLNQALTWTLWIGFIFITLSLLSGAMQALMGFIPATANLIPKVSWATLVWGWYLAILVMKGILGYRPQKVARMSLLGFLLLSVSWFGLLFWSSWRPI